MAVFGAEQNQSSQIASRYFDKYYIAVNIGAIIAELFIPIIQTDSNNQTFSNNYFFGYLTATFILVVAAILFIFGRRYYIHIPPYDSVLINIIPVTLNACQIWCKYHKDEETIHRSAIGPSLRNSWTSHDTMTHGNGVENDGQTLTLLDYAKAANHGRYSDRQVNDVKSLRRSIVVFALLIPYWIIYYQV